MTDDGHYSITQEREVMSECFRDLGLKTIAEKITKKALSPRKLKQYLDILVTLARMKKDIDVLDRLYFAGLIYDKGVSK